VENPFKTRGKTMDIGQLKLHYFEEFTELSSITKRPPFGLQDMFIRVEKLEID
jgi:hypothetical protein